MGRHLRYLPSVVIAAVVLGVAACVPPLPPFRGPVPVPIPSVVPTFVCTHHLLPGARYRVVIPQKGVWSFEWLDSLGNWHTATPWGYEVGDVFTIETPFTFRVTWNPEAKPGSPWFVVSPVTPLQAGPPCPDF